MDKGFDYFMQKSTSLSDQFPDEIPDIPSALEEEEEDEENNEEESDFDEDLMSFASTALPLTKEKLDEINQNWEKGFGDVKVTNRGSKVTFPPDDELVTIVLYKREAETNGETSHGQISKMDKPNRPSQSGLFSSYNIAQQLSSSINSLQIVSSESGSGDEGDDDEEQEKSPETYGPLGKKARAFRNHHELPVFDQSDLLKRPNSPQVHNDGNSSNSSSDEEPNLIEFEPKIIHQIISEKDDIFNHKTNGLEKDSNRPRHPFHIGSCLNNTKQPSTSSNQSLFPEAWDEQLFKIRHQSQRPTTATGYKSSNTMHQRQIIERVKSSENLSIMMNGYGKPTAGKSSAAEATDTKMRQEFIVSAPEAEAEWIKFEEPNANPPPTESQKFGLQGEALMMQRKLSPMRKPSSQSVDSKTIESESSTSNNSTHREALVEDYEMRAVIRGVFNPKTLGILQRLPKSPKLITLAKDQIVKRNVPSQLVESVFTPMISHFLVEKDVGFLTESKWATQTQVVRPTSAFVSSFITSLEKLNDAAATAAIPGPLEKYCSNCSSKRKQNEKLANGVGVIGKKKSLGKKMMKQNSLESSEEPGSSSLTLNSNTNSPSGSDQLSPPPIAKQIESKSKEKKVIKIKKQKPGAATVGQWSKDLTSVFNYIPKTPPKVSKGSPDDNIDSILRAAAEDEIKKLTKKSKPKSPKKSHLSDLYRKPTIQRPITANSNSTLMDLQPDKWITRAIAKTHKAEVNLLKKIRADKNPRLMDAYKVYFNGKPYSVCGGGGTYVKPPSYRPSTSSPRT